MTGRVPSRGGTSIRERDVNVGQVVQGTRISKAFIWWRRSKTYGDRGAIFYGMGERIVGSLASKGKLECQ